VASESVVRRNAAWLIVVVGCLVAFPYFEKLNNPNENVRVYATRALVAHGTFAIDDVIREWGPVQDRAVFEGRRYAAKAPGTALLGVPVYAVHRTIVRAVTGGEPSRRATVWVLRVFTVTLPVCLFLMAFGRGVQRTTGSPRARDLLVIGLGLGTLLYPYGLLYVGHAQSAACAFGAYLALDESQRRGHPGRWHLLAGLLAGMSVVFEYQALLVAAAIALFAVVTLRRRALVFLLGALLPALALGAYHMALFGSPWQTPLGHADDPMFAMYHAQGVLGFGVPRPSVAARALFGLDYGLFVWSPLLLAGLIGAAAALRGPRRREATLVLGATVLMLIFLSGMSNWRGGWCAGGPRYITAVAPFLTWGLALSWPAIAGRVALEAPLAGLAVAGVLLCGIAGAHFPHYPLTFDDPVFDVSLPLLASGYAPRGLGTPLGLPGFAAFVPVLLVLAAAAGLVLRTRLSGVLGGVVIAGAFLAAVGLANGRRTEDERRALELVRSVWEPAREERGSL